MRTLNCKRVAQTISLYVAGDLAGEHEREVAAHLATCEGCRRLAEEFSESSSLLAKACIPPEFGTEFYSGIRHAVLGQIRRDRTLSKPPLFRRRWLYATAFAALVIAFGVMLQHFLSVRRETPQGLARAPQISGPASDRAKEANSSSPPQLSELPPSPQRSPGPSVAPRVQLQKILALVNARSGSRQFETRTPNASDRTQTALEKRTQIAQAMESSRNVIPDPESATLSGLSASTPFGHASASQVSRIEIQTADPNIRIIWLAPAGSGESEEINHDQDLNRK